MEENPQNQETQGQATEQSQNEFTIPDSYKDRGWAEKIKSTDDLWKGYDNAQSLIGKRPAGIPSNDASDDDWNQFYKAMGRPDEPKYDFNDPEGLPEGFDTSSFKEQAAQILHKAGLNTKQADAVYQEYLKLELESANQQGTQSAEQQAALEEQFEKLTKEHFGDDVDKYTELTKLEFDKHVPQSLKETFTKLTDMPDVLTALMAYTKSKQGEIDRIKKEYNAEGSLSSGEQSASRNIEDVHKEWAKLVTSPSARDFTSPEYKQTMTKIQELQGIIDRSKK